MYQRQRSQSLGEPPNLEGDKAARNVSINDNGNGEFSEGDSDERQAKQNLGTKIKVNKLSRISFTYGEKEVQI